MQVGGFCFAQMKPSLNKSCSITESKMLNTNQKKQTELKGWQVDTLKTLALVFIVENNI